jgi:uncharacterized protein DUF3592
MKEGTGSQPRKGARWLDALAISHLAFAVILAVMLVQTCRIMANPETATGVVESKRVRSGGEDPDTLELRYSFLAASGRRYDGAASVSQKVYERTSVADSVTVQYAADDPGNNRVSSDTGDPDVLRWVLYGIGGLGVFLYFGPKRWLALRRGEPDPVLRS